ncbi:MAG: hypothetical protein LLG01_12035 [Planctomycetaceae bacterium]|nr:hypothetical protein [Planctomycetaceae bacterium]
MTDIYAPLPREEVIKAVERKGPCRIPMIRSRWWGEGLWDQYGARLNELNKYPEDFGEVMINPLDTGAMGLSWKVRAGAGHDSNAVIPDWKHLDEFIARLPDPENPALPLYGIEHVDANRRQNRYMLFGWWGLFFERPWSLRGMEGLMTDYYLHGDEVHRMHDALCTLYEGYIRRAIRTFKPDGFWTSDDLGNQRQLMMKPDHFREFLKPYYSRIGRLCRENGMHFWLHSCGNNTEIMDDLINTGVSVFHPVQKHTMDEAVVARRFGDRMTFLVGFDVQHILQEGTPEDVRCEVRHLIDTFDARNGGMCMAAGNGIVRGTPFENIEAYLDESIRYGAEHRARFTAEIAD